MRPGAGFGDERPVKRQKLQQSITNMFGLIGPKFVEVAGVQLLCPYCHHKFRAPQGLVAHKHMHERNGHTVPKQRKLVFKNPLTLVPPCRTISPKKPKKLVEAVEADPPRSLAPSAPCVKEDFPLKAVAKKVEVMTRRFSVLEKLQIIEKSKELKTLSETCRWVNDTFNRSTFARKTLRAMLDKEEIFRTSSGTKKIRKTVRNKPDLFPRMEKELAQ